MQNLINCLQGFTPLHGAAYFGHEDVVKLLLDAGIPVDCEGPGNLTPFLTACQSGKISMVKLLFSKGAKITAKLLA
jgi:ankyrin repeat protein